MCHLVLARDNGNWAQNESPGEYFWGNIAIFTYMYNQVIKMNNILAPLNDFL